MHALARLVADGPPVTPDADTARRWATEELARAEYHRSGTSLLERVAEWLQHLLGGLDGTRLPSAWLTLVLVVVVLVVGLVAWRVAGPVRRDARAPRPGAAVLEDDTRSAAQLRAAADAAAGAGDWALAVVERFRAVVRGLEERAIVLDVPGRTADEVARAAGAELPDQADGLLAGAAVFDAVLYGGRRAGPADDQAARTLDAAVRAARRDPARLAAGVGQQR